jgi:hypothetical protein
MIRRRITFIVATAIVGLTGLAAFAWLTPAKAGAASLSSIAPNPSNSGPDSFYHVFFLRQSPHGEIQNKVEAILYIPVGDNDTGDRSKWNADTFEIVPNGQQGSSLDGTVCDVPAGTTINVKIAAPGLGNYTKSFTASNACNLDGSGFFQKFDLPNWPASGAKPNINQYSNKYQVNMTITFSTSSDNLGIRFQARGNGQVNMKVGQDGGVDYTPAQIIQTPWGIYNLGSKPVPSTNFPIVGNWNDIHGTYNASTIKVPFGS